MLSPAIQQCIFKDLILGLTQRSLLPFPFLPSWGGPADLRPPAPEAWAVGAAKWMGWPLEDCVCVRKRESGWFSRLLRTGKSLCHLWAGLKPMPSTLSLDTKCGQRPFRSVRKLNPKLKTVESSSCVSLGQLLNLGTSVSSSIKWDNNLKGRSGLASPWSPWPCYWRHLWIPKAGQAWQAT